MALPTLGVWEIRTTGSVNNGGGFTAGGAGTDYSQQDAAQVVFDGATKLLSNAAASATVNVTGATPDSTWVDNFLNITGGTNFTTGVYRVLSTASGTVTFDRAATTGAGASGAGNLGGAKASPGDVFASAVAGNVVWIKAGTYTVTSASNNVSNGCFTLQGNTGTNIAALRGYVTTRGDDATTNRPLIKADNVITTFTLMTGGGACYVEGIEMDGNLRTSSRGLNAGATAMLMSHCVLRNFTNNAFTASNNSSRFLCGRITGCTTQFALSGGMPQYSIIDNNSVSGCFPSAGIIVECIFANNSGATSDGILLNSNLLFGCTSYGNGRHNFNAGAVNQGIMADCISWNPGVGDGFTSSIGNTTPTLFNCLSGGASTGVNFGTNYSSVAKINCSTLTASPFVDAANGNFALNATAGGGLLARGLSTLGPFANGSTTAHFDIGAVQHGDPTQPAVGNVRLGTVYNDGNSTGTFVVPTVSQVSNGVAYGAGGSEFVGIATGGTYGQTAYFG